MANAGRSTPVICGLSLDADGPPGGTHGVAAEECTRHIRHLQIAKIQNFRAISIL